MEDGYHVKLSTLSKRNHGTGELPIAVTYTIPVEDFAGTLDPNKHGINMVYEEILSVRAIKHSSTGSTPLATNM